MRPKVAILDDWERLSPPLPAVRELAALTDLRIYHDPIPAADLPATLAGCVAVLTLRERTPFPPALLAALPDLRHIAQTGGGVAHIDVPAATARGIAVSVTVGSAGAVAELALGMMLSLAHRLAESDGLMRAGDWPLLTGTELAGKTLGLIGLGRIGVALAARARACELRLLAWSPHITPERAAAAGATAVDLDELLAESDYASIHLRLSPDSRGLLDYARLRRCKPGLILINTARSPIVPEPDLIQALQERILGGAGLDVFDQEPLPPDHPLRALPNVLLTPHVGWTTRENITRFLTGAVDNLRAYLSGAPTNIINAAALSHQVAAPPTGGHEHGHR